MGCSEEYYAVGLSLKCPHTKSLLRIVNISKLSPMKCGPQNMRFIRLTAYGSTYYGSN